jgi:two-component system cell cycle response regulator DivK
LTSEIRQRKPINPGEAWVLVVEDNPGNFALVARLLAYTGIAKSEWKTSGWGVVDFAAQMERVDLILMDLRLPHEDGYQVLKEIRSHPELKNTQVVLVTALGSQMEMDRAKAAGFDGFIAKPLDVNVFPDQIQALLRGEQIWSLGRTSQ